MGNKLVLSVFLFFLTTLLPKIWAMQYKSNGGHRIPMVGLGTFTVTNEEELSNALNKALEIGYRHIDTAAAYQNEHIIGKVLKEWISSGKINRQDLFITTKIAPVDLYPDQIEKALNSSLEKLQLDYLDLYLIHLPVAFKLNDNKMVTAPTDLIGVWKKMEEQVDAGKIKTIGLSNCNISQIERIQKIARIQPANLQIEIHAYFQQRELCDFAHNNNITVVAYSPLASPGANTFMKIAKYAEVTLPNILSDEVVTKIAEKHTKSPAQIVLRFLIQSDIVVIPKSTNPKRLKENFEVFDFKLDEDDMGSLAGLDKGKKAKIFNMVNAAPNMTEHPEYPFHENL